MNTQELEDLENKDPELYNRMLKRSYDILGSAGGEWNRHSDAAEAVDGADDS